MQPDRDRMIGEIMQGLFEFAVHIDPEVQGGKAFIFQCPVQGRNGVMGTLKVTVQITADRPAIIQLPSSGRA